MTPDAARALVRSARRRLALNDPARDPLLAALVRDDPAELLALAAANPEPEPAPAARAVDPLLETLAAVNPAEAEWLAGARARHAQALARIAEARTGQGTLAPAAPAPERPALPSTLDRPALQRQRGLWEAA